MSQRNTVRSLQPSKSMPLHRALKALTYTRSRHIDHLPRDEMRRAQFRTDGQDGVFGHLK